MTIHPPADRLLTPEAVAEHLRRLVRIDPRLAAVHDAAGAVLPRTREPGFAGLARIICGQSISVKAADALWRRMQEPDDATTPAGFLRVDEAGMKRIGLSRGKYRTLMGIAHAIDAGELDLESIETLPAEDAIAALTRYKGIGPWTAEVYLLFCTGHPDVFPSGDIALQKAVGNALGLGAAPGGRGLAAIAAGWSPHRAAAALLFWRFYRTMRGREGVGL
jgi:DNA-3-methyladenine glycosylase II